MPFAEGHDWIYAAAGVHPHEAKLATQARYDELSRLAQHPRFLAWGEIGLDYHYEEPPRNVQQRVFVEQLELARGGGLAGGAALPGRLGGLPDDPGAALARLGAGRHLPLLHGHAGAGAARHGDGLPGLVCRERDVSEGAEPAGGGRERAAGVVADRDGSPFLAPQGQRGRRNEPAYVAEVAKTLGPVRNLPPAEVAAATAGNFRRFFRLG